MRPCDIRRLTLDAIDWREERIDLQQVKTGRLLVLPLLPDVADALGAYLLDGRPASTDRTVFLRHFAPFEPFAIENNLATIMREALRRAGLADRTGRRGLYLLRHTLATRLLAAGHPLKAIADVLGHASTQTTYGYSRVEVDGLPNRGHLRGGGDPMSTLLVSSCPTFISPLASKLVQFLAQKHAMGYRHREEGRALRELDCFLKTHLSPEDPLITLEIVHGYVARRGTESESTRAHRLTLMREVCRFLRLEDARTVVPDRRSLRIVCQRFVPRVLSRDEGKRFLQACAELPQGRTSPVRDAVLGTALRPLYLAGLRAGELLRLTQADVDLDAGLLRIRHSKFDKSRVVPIAPDLVQQLVRCRTLATQDFGSCIFQKPFFASPRGGRYSITALRDAFHQTLKTAGIERTSENRHIRLHDLRHYAEFRTMPSKSRFMQRQPEMTGVARA